MSRRAPLTELTAALIDVKWRGELQPDGTQSVMLVVRPVGGVGADAGDFSSLASTELTLWLTVTPDELDTPKPDAPACLRLIRGCDYRFYGRYKDSTYRGKAEKQFTATSYGPAEQHTRESVIRYLEANGAGLGFGARRAALLYDRFGSQAVKVARLQSEVVEAALAAEKLAIPLDKLESLAARLQASASVEDSLLELSGILRGKGFPRRLPTDLVRAKGAGAASWLKTVHFGLLQEGWSGCGFKKCDALHVNLGLPLDCLERQMFSAWHAIKVDRSGSTWFPETFVACAIKANIGGTDVRVEDAIQYGIDGGWMTRVHTEHVNGAIVSSQDKLRARMSWIAHGRNATNEQIVAEKLAQLASADVAWPSVDAVEGVTDHQREALRKATAGAVATLIGGPGTGKAQPLEAKILTPYGWSTMGEIGVGDYVIGVDGHWKRVTAEHPQGMKQVFLVTFSDGSKTECCEDHLWSTKTRNDRKRNRPYTVRSTKEIAATIYRTDGGDNHSIPMVCPVFFNSIPLPLDPYVMGLLIGNGCFRVSPSYSTADAETLPAVQQAMPDGMVIVKSKTNKFDHRLRDLLPKQNRLKNILVELGLWGKLSTEKHIPEIYLTASPHERIELLNGLLDTDGYTDGHNIEYSTSSKQLAADFQFLVLSLGGKVTVTLKPSPVFKHKGEIRHGQDSYRILVSLPSSIAPFQLTRKRLKYIPKSKYPPSRRITSIEPVGVKECKCITVEGDHYVTDDFIVTHNSFTTGAYIKRCVEAFGEDNVAVAAPTNKAAVRLTQALRAYNIPLAAVSEHRLLGVDTVNGSSWEFRHKESRPLPYKVLFLDESSMRSLSMQANILRACCYGTHIFFVGDTMQLPPIESGSPFRDTLMSKVLPFGELVEPMRNAGDIVFACDDIRRGILPFRQSAVMDWTSDPPRNFKIVNAETPEAQVEKLMELLPKLKAAGFDPVWDCQVIVAINKASQVARIPLNEKLQRELNPNGQGPKGAIIRTNDKVVCEENGMYEVVDDGKKLPSVFIAKGEFGRVVVSETAKVQVLFDGQEKPVVVPFWNVGVQKADDLENATSVEESSEGGDDDAGNKINLAYACTTHKLQGSETKVAIVMIDESRGAKAICTKEHFFTGISRGKVATFGIGKESVAQEFCRRSSLTGRKTFLAELIREKVVGRMVEGLV